MPEQNPYEPPQTELRSTPSMKPRAAANSTTVERWFVTSILGLQFLVGALIVLAPVMRENTLLSLRRMQMLGELFAVSFFVLGIAVVPLAMMRGSRKLVMFEILTLLFVVWLTLPAFR